MNIFRRISYLVVPADILSTSQSSRPVINYVNATKKTSFPNQYFDKFCKIVVLVNLLPIFNRKKGQKHSIISSVILYMYASHIYITYITSSSSSLLFELLHLYNAIKDSKEDFFSPIYIRHMRSSCEVGR